MEIMRGNHKFLNFINQDFVITDLTIAEFYSVLYREGNEKIARHWYNKLSFYYRPVSNEILIKALKYRIDNKKDNLSIFDCVGYLYSLENNLKFVTGDIKFKHKPGVLFIQK